MLSEKAAEFMREHKPEGKECMRLRLSMEEILLKLRDRFGASERDGAHRRRHQFLRGDYSGNVHRGE